MIKTPTVGLSLRLLRQGISPDKAMKEAHGLEEVPSTFGTLFVGQKRATAPEWTKFLSYYNSDAASRLHTQSCSAVLLIKVGRGKGARLFALCFGQGHHAIADEALQRGFGLRVVLNSVSRGKLRTLDSASLDTTVLQRRVQASRDSDLRDFDLDASRNLLRLASGTPKSGEFAKALAGKDALHLRAAVSPDKIAEHCKKALSLYQASDYKADFAFIDYVQPVEEPDKVKELDLLVLEEVRAMVQGAPSDLHLAIPDILSPEGSTEIGYFGSGLPAGSKTVYGELNIQDYVAELIKGDITKVKDMEALKAGQEIRIIADGEGDRSHKRKVYSCFVHEVTIGGEIYVLFDSQWFRVSREYHKDVDTAYAGLLKPSFRSSTAAGNERDFIAELESASELISMDQTKVAPKGAGNAALEPCDFLSQSKQLIHLNDGHSSAPLSHLWNQGLVSAEAFVSDEVFRKGFRTAAQARERKFKKDGFSRLLPDGRSKPVTSEYTVVFGVMRHPYAASGKLGLPFFSKVALRASAERIIRMGFPVELHLIEKT